MKTATDQMIPTNVDAYNLGFQAGLKRAAEIAVAVQERVIPIGAKMGCAEVEQAILNECRSPDDPSSS